MLSPIAWRWHAIFARKPRDLNGVQGNARREVLKNEVRYLHYSYWNGDYAGGTIFALRILLGRILEIYFNFFEIIKMKKVIFFWIGLLLFLFTSGCELLCQAGTGTCGMSSEQMDKLLHPKAYGEHFVKPRASQEEWQRDWVACGGWSNGQFSGGAPNGSPTSEIFAAIDRARNSLNACMQAKGYEYRETN